MKKQISLLILKNTPETNKKSKYFEYKENSKMLVLKKKLDRESTNKYKLKIESCDNGEPKLLVWMIFVEQHFNMNTKTRKF